MITVKQLKAALEQANDDAVVHLCIDDWVYEPFVEMFWEKPENPQEIGVFCLRPDPKGAITKMLDAG